MRCSSEVLRLSLRDPFRIARDEPAESITTVIVTVDLDGAPGIGEAFPVAYYGETVGTVNAVLPLLVEAVEGLGSAPRDQAGSREWLERASRAMDAAIARHGAAKCALDTALHDALSRRLGLPLHAFLGTSGDIPPTDFSLGIDAPATVAQRASRMAHFPALKVKVGGPDDLATLRAVRDVYDGPIRVDANTGWSLAAAEKLLPELAALGVELIEQPFPANALAALRALQERTVLPIVADESAVTIDDLEGLVGVVAGVNVKLTKCGGVGPALRMMHRAQELGFRVFLGCMEETSVGIAAATAVASLAEWVDLDGNLLLADEPFEGLVLGDDCRWKVPTSPGLGVTDSRRG